jgi:formamidopyrimidine-DNA glycosylase
MPELPEVETIATSLRLGNGSAPPLPGQTVRNVQLKYDRHIVTPSKSSFRRRIRGQSFSDVTRRGKYLVLPMDSDTLLIHLMMSGDLGMFPKDTPLEPHDRTILELDSNWSLRFNDPRKFGRVFLLKDPGQVLDELGPEPLSGSFDSATLAEKLKKHRRPLKSLLLDQKFLAGLGNIYTDEALHRAKLHPLRPSDSLQGEEPSILWRSIRETLKEGIRHNGSSIDWVYRGGEFQNHFRVYGREAEACLTCGSPIMRILVGQRSTHFCPNCQPEVDV